MNQLVKNYLTEPLAIIDKPLLFVPAELLHFEEAYDKCFEKIFVSANAVTNLQQH